MRLAISLLLASAAAAAAQPRAVVLESGERVSFTHGSLGTQGDMYREARWENVAPSPSGRRFLFQDNWIYVDIDNGSTSIRCTSGIDSKSVSLAIGSRTDVRIRVTRSVTDGRFRCDMWDADGSNHTFGSTGISASPSNFDGATPRIGSGMFEGLDHEDHIGFVRAFTGLPANYLIPPADAPATPGDMWDFRFQDSLDDSGPGGYALTINTGSPAYQNSAVADPVAIVAEWEVARAGYPVTLDASASFASRLDTGVPTFTWEQFDGPDMGVFSDTDVASITFTPSSRGQYDIVLTVSDGIVEAEYEVAVGSVVTDDHGLVDTGLDPDSPFAKMLGPVTRLGTSPWPWYDKASKALIDEVYGAALDNQLVLPAAPYTGTVQLLDAPVRVVGTGTEFTSELTVGDCVIVAWDAIDGPGTGRLWVNVASITDDTHIQFALFNTQVDLGSGLTMYPCPAESSTVQRAWWNLLGQPNYGWLYYDGGPTAYSMYYRTGLVKYLDWARTLGDIHWEWAIDHGRAGVTPRASNPFTNFMRALDPGDPKPERLPDLYTLHRTFFWVTGPSHNPSFEGREAGAALAGLALTAMADADPTRHANACATLKTQAASWHSKMGPDGYIVEDLWGAGTGYPYALPLFAGWRVGTYTSAGLRWSSEATSDSEDEDCYDADIAANAKADAVSIIRAVGERSYSDPALGGNRGTYYDVDSRTNGQSLGTTGAGTISISGTGTNVVTGVGTEATFTGLTCGGTYYLAVNGSTSANRKVQRITGCPSTTELTLDGNWIGSGAVSGVTYKVVAPMNDNCASIVTHCYPSINGDRNLQRMLPGSLAWAYSTGLCDECLDYAKEAFSSFAGGPADGPGGSAACGGPDCDGTQTDFVSALGVCGASNPPPCAVGSGTEDGPFAANVQGKNMNEGNGGFARAYTALGYFAIEEAEGGSPSLSAPRNRGYQRCRGCRRRAMFEAPHMDVFRGAVGLLKKISTPQGLIHLGSIRNRGDGRCRGCQGALDNGPRLDVFRSAARFFGRLITPYREAL